MTTAYIQLGTNMGNKINNLSLATKHIIMHCGFFVTSSSTYETAAWGNNDQENFLNQIVVIKTNLNPFDLLKKLLSIEIEMGRVRLEKYGSRIIDLDILFYGNEIINELNLTVPHPHITARKFVLVPLAEITPNKIHPVYKKSLKTLLKECIDTLDVKKV